MGLYYPQNSQGLVRDILPIIDPLVDFTRYDGNGDGYVDSIIFLFEGQATGSGHVLWPHAWALGPRAYSTDEGVVVDAYSMVNEQDLDGNLEPVGSFVHEFFHVLGAPDRRL